MREYVIITDSCSDLDKKKREEYNIEYVPMHYTYNGKEVVALLDWEELPPKDFYDVMRSGTRIFTSQVNALDYKETFEKWLNAGYDVLYISCSSALSASIKSSLLVRDELMNAYPDAKIICVDSLCACMGLGLLTIRAAELREEGKTIEETAAWIEKNRNTMHQECTVDSLQYLKQAGRVSAASAFFGGILNVKPIIISDAIGRNNAVEKVKGKKKAFSRIVERVKEQFEQVPYQRVFISHADCIDAAEEMKELILKALPNVEVEIGYIGPIIGATVGPGTIGVYFYGKEVTYGKE